jgi:hypothetical protein
MPGFVLAECAGVAHGLNKAQHLSREVVIVRNEI